MDGFPVYSVFSTKDMAPSSIRDKICNIISIIYQPFGSGSGLVDFVDLLSTLHIYNATMIDTYLRMALENGTSLKHGP